MWAVFGGVLSLWIIVGPVLIAIILIIANYECALNTQKFERITCLLDIVLN